MESHLGQHMVMSQVGDIVLNHQQGFQKVYVPYITNMMYQEALITQLLFVLLSCIFHIEHINLILWQVSVLITILHQAGKKEICTDPEETRERSTMPETNAQVFPDSSLPEDHKNDTLT